MRAPHRDPSPFAAVMRAAAALVLATALVLGAAQAASAHVPRLEPPVSNGPVTIGGPEVSRATYGYLAPGEQYDEYRFSVSEPVTSVVGIIVPAYPEHAEFRPTLVITSAKGDTVEISDPGQEPRQQEFEPFSLTTFWRGGERAVRFEPGVQCTMRVEPGRGSPTDRYVIVCGGPEGFDAADTRATFQELPLIWFGAYGGAPLHFNALALIPIGLMVLLLAAVVVGVWRLLTRSHRRALTRSS